MDAQQENLLGITRRHFFRDCGVGVGKIALASLLSGSLTRSGFAAGTTRDALRPIRRCLRARPKP